MIKTFIKLIETIFQISKSHHLAKPIEIFSLEILDKKKQ